MSNRKRKPWNTHRLLYLKTRNRFELCPAWAASLQVFKEDVGELRSCQLIYPLDTSAPIGPDNFEWVRSTGTMVDGKCQTLQTVGDLCGITRERVRQRINKLALEGATRADAIRKIIAHYTGGEKLPEAKAWSKRYWVQPPAYIPVDPPPRNKYLPYLDGQLHVLVKGVDFHCSVAEFVTPLRAYGNNHGYRLTSRHIDDMLLLKVTLRSTP